ncbi:hypothetical protein FHX49_002487 [Microbacterium endophyticum]|uniref:Lipoprotein n=1 Tax=Microbacterium endophyticum TaxID=1526412 RepID=A0A7W4YNT4_9MICO|nr:hypothetical protein [Microbacterium endophyticum]MBB2976899.1 hypothetical protein [Microbacterium endophyticum]NIK35783.1 hypothetical protein [Microbacterium endophyticum]
MALRRTRLFGAALIIGTLALVAGCADIGANPEATGDAGVQVDVNATWLDDGRMIGMWTSGSSSCTPAVSDVALNDAGILEVNLEDADETQPCTADMASQVTLFDVPEGVDTSSDATLEVRGTDFFGTAEVAGVPGLAGPGTETDYAPSAGWVATYNNFIILTWGSSTCAPTVEKSAITGSFEVTVTFADPPADQMCTMDMAPRGTSAFAGGMKSGDAEVVLTGDSFDGIRVPILGSN